MPICRYAVVLKSRSSALAASRHPSRCTDPAGNLTSAAAPNTNRFAADRWGHYLRPPPSLCGACAALPCPALIPCATAAFATHLGAETMDRLVLPQLEAVPVRAGLA